MRIALVSTYGGGVEAYVRTVSNWLLDQGHTVHVLFVSRRPRAGFDAHERLHIHHERIENLHYYLERLRLTRPQRAVQLRAYEFSKTAARALRRVQSQAGLDIVELFEGIGHPKLFEGLPFVYKMHGAEWTFRCYCEDGPWYDFQPRDQRQMIIAAGQAQTLSRSLADFIAGACTVSRSLIEVMPYPIDTAQFSPDVPPAPIPPYRLMSVGRLEKRKGTHTLVAAMRQVWAHEPDTHLHLFGSDGDFGRAHIERMIPPGEHGGRLHFEGFVERPALVEAYRQTHVYVAPTRYETFGYTILEAMACGRPVIATDIGPVPELVQPERTGWLVPRDDPAKLATAIVQALCKHTEREQLGIGARRFARQFALETIMPRQIQSYEQVIHAYRPR